MTVFVLLVSTLITHMSIPHYPLVVDLVIKDDIITKHNAAFLKRDQDDLLVVLVPGFRHNVG